VELLPIGSKGRIGDGWRTQRNGLPCKFKVQGTALLRPCYRERLASAEILPLQRPFTMRTSKENSSSWRAERSRTEVRRHADQYCQTQQNYVRSEASLFTVSWTRRS